MRGATLRWALAAAALLGAFGCRGDDWVIAGAGRDEEIDSGDEDAPPIQLMPPVVCPSAATLLEERSALYRPEAVSEVYTGRWRGTLSGAAAAGFPSESLELELDGAGRGSLWFESASPPPASDPGSGYLCSAGSDGAVLCGSRSGFVGGYRYPLERVTSRGDVLSFVLVQADPWGPWCQLQQPIEWPDPDTACGSSFDVQLPGADTVTTNGCARIDAEGEATDIDCALMYTLRRCECGSDACVAAYEDGIEVGLELSEAGAALSGSLWYSGDVDRAPLTLRR
jgi:hypothetical protein